MPSVKSKGSKTKVAPEDEIRLFASSRRGPEVKVKPKARRKLEDGSPSFSQSPMKGTLAEAMELSDSEADAPRVSSKAISKPRESDEQEFDSGASTDLPSLKGFDDDAADTNVDMLDMMSQHSRASSHSTPKRKNTAKCSRGKKSAKLRPNITHEDLAVRKVSAFKPMKTNGQTSALAQKKSVEVVKDSGADEESTDEDFEPNTTGDTDMTYNTLRSEKSDEITQSPIKMRKTKALIPDESDTEEFHELSDFRRSASAERMVAPKSVKRSPKKQITSLNREPSLASSEEQVDMSINDVAADRIHASSKETTPRAGHASATPLGYISREEFDITIQRLKQDWKDEMHKMQTAIRLDTKRLIRSEVKDEMLLSQPAS